MTHDGRGHGEPQWTSSGGGYNAPGYGPPGMPVGGGGPQFHPMATTALVLGILVAYMVLASQFNSFLDPVTVLTILPLSLAGAMFAIAIAGKEDG